MTAIRFSHQLKNTYTLLRHGETDANIQRIYMGRLDLELNEKGVAQAQTVNLPIYPDRIFVSPLKRSRQTADIVAKKFDCYPYITDKRLIEKSGGSIEGKTYEQIGLDHPDVWGIWESKSLDEIRSSRFPNGESDIDVTKRVAQLITEIERDYEKKQILFITHSGVIQAIRYLFGKSKDEIYLDKVEACSPETY